MRQDNLARSFTETSAPVPKSADVVAMDGQSISPNELIRRRQYAAQMEMWHAAQALKDNRLKDTRVQHQPGRLLP